MSNKKHIKCVIRTQANDAKKRLLGNDYSVLGGALSPPKNISPSQKVVYLKLKELMEHGEEVDNPIQQLADTNTLAKLTHEEKQRYILQLSADYIAMKKALNEKIVSNCNSSER